MQASEKDWLVRTQGGEILGPFTQLELVEGIKQRLFTLDDEIAPSCGSWVSAQALAHREGEEVTHTSTRNPTQTDSYSPSREWTGSGELTLTPTPKATRDAYAPDLEGRSPHVPRSAAFPVQKVRPFLLGSILVLAAWALLSQFRVAKKNSAYLETNANSETSAEGESPFVKEIYALIRAGETGAALKRLTHYHEGHPAKGDVEYLVPYATLLIMEKESSSRAKKFLEQVLQSGASAQLKSRAHHWLGYLALSQNEGDMGESHFLEALGLNPKDAAARFNLGRAYLKQEKFSQALDYLQLAELEVPDLWLVHIYKGRAKVALGSLEEARSAFKTAVQSAPDRWLSYVYYALFLKGIDEPALAQNTLRAMLTRDPHYEVLSPPPLGFFQEKINYGEYLSAFNHIMEKSSPDERELGKLYIGYLANSPDSNEGRRIEALAEKRGGLRAEVLALKVQLERKASPDVLRASINRLPANLSDFGYYAYVLRGKAYSQIGSMAEAQKDFQRALVLEPKLAIVRYAYAELLQSTQRFDEAKAELKVLRNYHPGYVPAIVQSPE